MACISRGRLCFSDISPSHQWNCGLNCAESSPMYDQGEIRTYHLVLPAHTPETSSPRLASSARLRSKLDNFMLWKISASGSLFERKEEKVYDAASSAASVATRSSAIFSRVGSRRTLYFCLFFRFVNVIAVSLEQQCCPHS